MLHGNRTVDKPDLIVGNRTTCSCYTWFFNILEKDILLFGILVYNSLLFLVQGKIRTDVVLSPDDSPKEC